MAREQVAIELNKQAEQLLEELLKEAFDNTHTDTRAATLVMAKFAALLVILAKQSDVQARRVVLLTWGLLVLTAVLFLLTTYMCYDIYRKG